MKRNILILIVSLGALSTTMHAQDSDYVYFANGFKIGELTDSTAVIWTRLCSSKKPVPIRHKQKGAPFKSPIDFDNTMPISEMDGAVEGSFGEIKIQLQTKDTVMSSDWIYVSAYKDFTHKQRITGLFPNTEYTVLIQGRKKPEAPITEVKGSFMSPPLGK